MKQCYLVKFYFIIFTNFFMITTAWGISSKQISNATTVQPQANISSKTTISTQLIFTDYHDKIQTATFSTNNILDESREYYHVTTQVLRDGSPQQRVYRELPEQVTIRTGNLAFDALFALAINDMQLNSVLSIRDDAYNNSEPILCDCFETGEKWHYVWTRDISYAANLSLAILAPIKVKNSLEFKLSTYRDGLKKPSNVAGSANGLQIIQDTGSGGSWPVSTDRVTWAFGAGSVLANLPKIEREKFSQKARIALINTIENDRLAAFDKKAGLYTGEQSFLDWREQSYATWLPHDLANMSSAKALSTNVMHYQALKLAERLSNEHGDLTLAIKYQHWAEQLKKAINKYLWLDDVGMYSSLTAGHFDNSPMYKFDWLGQSLAIITGIANAEKRQRILANYPHSTMGAPVIFPQQPGIPIYHNRAIWPFVTAYGLKAAKLGENTAVANSAFNTLIQGAALNLSNMENFEWLSGEPFWLDKNDNKLSGPVINSKRQLWSVAAYLGMVVNDVFGVKITYKGLAFQPFITTKLREKYFSKQKNIQLNNLTWLGKVINIEMYFPENSEQQGFYPVDYIVVNGVRVNGVIHNKDLSTLNHIQIHLAKVKKGENGITSVKATQNANDESIFAPYEPKLNIEKKEGRIGVNIIDQRNSGDISYQIYRNGKRVINNVNLGRWLDREQTDGQVCYSATATFVSSQNQSHHSQVVCTLPAIDILVNQENIQTNVAINRVNKLPVIEHWGSSNDIFHLKKLTITTAGKYAIQFNYTNNSNAINTGITNGVKWLKVYNIEGKLIAQGTIQFPHTQKNHSLSTQYLSTALIVNFPLGRYSMALSDHYNMSYLAKNKSYAAQGGKSGAWNKFNLYSVHLLPLAN